MTRASTGRRSVLAVAVVVEGGENVGERYDAGE
jgi:hypothetical protein